MDFKKDFPIFKKRDLVYLDSAATAQKPKQVLDAINEYYTHYNSNIHRGPNFLSEEATVAYEDARRTVADFINAPQSHEVIFTRNATESLNLLARSMETMLKPGDEILLSELEHHSNIVPWLQLKEKIGVKLNYIPVNNQGQLEFSKDLLTTNTKVVSITAMSNGLGSITDLEPIIQAAQERNLFTIVDASQLIVHSPIDVQALGVDAVVFSGHKLYGPTGIGVLWAKEEHLRAMPPFLGGGDMINEVFKDHYTPADLPSKYEAGTPNIAGAIGLKAAIDYILHIGYDNIQKHEEKLLEKLLKEMHARDYITIIGAQTSEGRGPVVSFHLEGVHPHDIAEGLSQAGVVIRAGHHCNQILMDCFKIPGTARISLGIYNTEDDIDKAMQALDDTYNYFK